MLRIASLIAVPVLGLLAFLLFFTDWHGFQLKPDAFLGFGANLILAGLTAFYVYLTHALLQNQTAAVVVVYADRKGSQVRLVIENTGNGLARNLRFTTSQELMCVPPLMAMTTAAAQNLQQMCFGPLVTGIPALAAGQRRVVFWGPLHILRDWLHDGVIDVTCTFTEGEGNAVRAMKYPLELHSLSFSGEELESIRSLSPHDRLEQGIDRVGRALESVEKAIERRR